MRLTVSQSPLAQVSTSGRQKVSGQERFYTKNGQFHTLIPPPIHELKIGQVHRMLREYVTLNEFKLSEV